MLVYQRVIVVSAIEIWYKHLDKMTLQVIYQQDLSLMILRVSIVSLFSPVFPFWMGCLLVEPPKIMLSFKPHWRNQHKSTYIYIYIISLCQILIFVVFFWEELPTFFSTGDPVLDRRRSRRPPGARLAPAWRWWSWSKLRLGGRCGLPQELDGLEWTIPRKWS